MNLTYVSCSSKPCGDQPTLVVKRAGIGRSPWRLEFNRSNKGLTDPWRASFSPAQQQAFAGQTWTLCPCCSASPCFGSVRVCCRIRSISKVRTQQRHALRRLIPRSHLYVYCPSIVRAGPHVKNDGRHLQIYTGCAFRYDCILGQHPCPTDIDATQKKCQHKSVAWQAISAAKKRAMERLLVDHNRCVQRTPQRGLTVIDLLDRPGTNMTMAMATTH